MSDDYSNQDKDYSKRTKRRGGGPGGGPTGDYRQPRKPQGKEYQGSYDSRGYDKSSKDQYGSNKGSYYNQYDDYDSRPPKNDNYSSYKPKGGHQRRQDPAHGAWKKKAAKITKESILEAFAKAKPHAEIATWLREYKDLFVKEKQAMVNDEVFQLDPNNGLMPKTTRPPPSGNGTQNESDSVPETAQKANEEPSNKGLEMFDFGKERFDPIQAMRNKNRKDQDKDATKGKRDEALEENLEDERNIRALESGKGQKGLEDNHEEALETLEGDNKDLEGDFEEGEYSNIDEMFAKKLKNNEIPETYEDAFDDLVAPERTKEKLQQLEDNERPDWEDIDTKKVIEDIQKEDFMSSLPQDRRAIFGETEQKPQDAHNFAQSRFLDANKNSADKQASKEFDIDFSKYNFDVDLKAPDDFLIKQEDLFPSGFSKNTGQPQAMGPQGMGPGQLNPANYQAMMMQQGNMMRPTPQQLQGMQYQQMPQMHQQQQHPMHPMQQMDYMGMQMRGMGPMGGPDDMNRPQQQYNPYANPNQPGYMMNQLPPYKRDPAREAMNMNVPRPQTAPTVIFKYFSPVYEEKSWFYIDMQKRVQGPFSGRTMDEWYLQGHLPPTLNVTIGKNNGYKTIKELADIIANPNQAIPGHPRGPPPQEPQMPPMGNPQAPQGYSGISDLLSNRPDLMQYSSGASGKPKPLDEQERPGPGANPAQYSQYAQYLKPGGQTHPDYNERQGQYPGGGKPYQQGGVSQGYAGDNQNQMMYAQNPNAGPQKMSVSAHPGIGSEAQGKVDPNLQGLNMSKSVSSNPADATKQGGQPLLIGGERPSSETTIGDSQGDQGTRVASAPAQNAGASPLQGLATSLGGGAQAVDMTLQLKNMLGIGGLNIGGAGLNLGGAGLNIGGPSVSEPPKKTEPSVAPQKEQQVERQLSQPQPQTQAQPQPQLQAQALPQVQQERMPGQYQEKQPQRQEKQQNYNQYNYQEKQQQQQQQPQKKGTKVPKIDTSDFPSLTETYK